MLRVTRVTAGLIAGIAALTLGAGTATADDGDGQQSPNVQATLEPKNEVPPIFTGAKGEFEGTINAAGDQLTWRLRYEGLEGTVTQAHIHAAPTKVNGGIMVWFCSNLTSPPTPPGVQPCPAPPADITGTFGAADVVGPTGQAITPGDFEEFLQALRTGLAYANVHSTLAPGGEIRGQVRPGS